MAPGLHLRFVLLFLFTSVCTSNAFNFYSRNLDSAPPILLESPIRSESDLLDQSLSKAFPSRTHANPAYAEVFKYLESLSTAPSCHRAATASLITDCNTLESTSAAGYRYAAHLAVCEFEAAGVAYPHECKDIARRGHHRCMKRLEERPQWWTTFSNSNQNAMMICVAVRHEVEQDRLLGLHRNVTKAQEQLLKAMDVSLDQVSESQAEQKEMVEAWNKFVTRVKGEMDMLERQVSEKVEMGGLSLEAAMNELADAMAHAREDSTAAVEKMAWTLEDTIQDSIHRAENSKQTWIDTEGMISQILEAQRRDFSLSKKAIDEINSLLSAASSDLKGNAMALSFELKASRASTDQLALLPGLYSELVSAHTAMSHSQKQQQDRQRDLQQKLEELAPQIETMVTRMLGSAEKVDQTLQNADARILGFGGGNTRYIIPGMVYSAIVLRLGGENWRTMVGTGLGLGAAWILWEQNPQLHTIMDWPWITKVEVSGKEITMDIIGSDTVAGILFVNATYVIASGSILALAVVTFVACNARRRKRVSVETFEKLPA